MKMSVCSQMMHQLYYIVTQVMLQENDGQVMPCPEVINEARNSLPIICLLYFTNLFPAKIINDFSSATIRKLWFCKLGSYISLLQTSAEVWGVALLGSTFLLWTLETLRSWLTQCAHLGRFWEVNKLSFALSFSPLFYFVSSEQALKKYLL